MILERGGSNSAPNIFIWSSVIVTSYGWSGLGMYASQEILDQYNASYAATTGSSFRTGMMGSAGLGYNPNTKMTDKTRPDISLGTSFYDSNTQQSVTNEAMNSDYYRKNGTTYKQAKSVQDIVNWLSDNHIQ